MFFIVIGLTESFHLIDYCNKASLTTRCGLNFKRNKYNLLALDNLSKNICKNCEMEYSLFGASDSFRFDRSFNQQNILYKADRYNNMFNDKYKMIMNRNWVKLTKYKSIINKRKFK